MTFDCVLETVVGVIKSLGLELMIFGLTVTFALAARSASGTLPSWKGVSGGSKCVDLPARPAAARPPSRPPSPPGGRGRCAESVHTAQKQPWQIVDEIMNIMHFHNTNQHSAAQALRLYSQLRLSLGLFSAEVVAPFSDVIRCSRHSAIDFYTTLVHCAVRSSQCNLVTSLMDDMANLNVARSLSFYESAMKQLAGQKQHQLALSTYDRLRADGLEASAVTYSCLVGFASEVGENERAVAFFVKLSSLATPSIRAYMTILRVYSKQQDWAASVATLLCMQRRGVPLDSPALNIVLATGVANDKLAETTELLAETEAMNKTVPDVVSYNTVIKGYAQRRDTVAAYEVLVRMRMRGLSPNAITFNTLMDACVRSQKMDQALEIHGEMHASGIRPDKFTCSILVKGLSKQATPEQLQAVLELLWKVGDCCDDSLKSALYQAVFDAASRSSDDVILMRTVAQMRKHGVALSAVASRKVRERCSELSWQTGAGA